MIRFLDLIFSILGLTFLSPIMLIILVVGYFDSGTPIFMQKRVGRKKQPFTLIKFRTMRVGTPSVASHLSERSSVTKLGGFLRKTKMDELPQLINVFLGQMSLVGPRPNLFNQADLINCRELMGVYNVRPGITGLAQIKNIDMSTPRLLSKVDKLMIDNSDVCSYFFYIYMTVFGRGKGDAVK